VTTKKNILKELKREEKLCDLENKENEKKSSFDQKKNTETKIKVKSYLQASSGVVVKVKI